METETERLYVVTIPPWLLNIKFEVRNSRADFTFGDLKKKIGEQIHLKEASLCLFGLYDMYTSAPMIPLELYGDNDIIKGSHYHLGFMRRSFDEIREREIVGLDGIAIDLFFWEARLLLDVGRVVGNSREISKAVRLAEGGFYDSVGNIAIPLQLKVEQHRFVPAGEERILRMFSETESSLKRFQADVTMSPYAGASHILFLEQVHALSLFYWSYYYQVPDCTLCGNTGKLLASHMNLNKKLKVDVALSRSCLSLLGATATKQYLHFIDFPWSSIRYMIMNHFKKELRFQILLEDKEDTTAKYVMINIQTDRYKYIFSVANYILEIQETIFSQLGEGFFCGNYQDNIVEVNSIRPASIDCDSFLSMILTYDALEMVLKINGIQMASPPKQFDIIQHESLPTGVTYPETLLVNETFCHIIFRLRNMTNFNIQTSPTGYHRVTDIIHNYTLRTIPACISDRVAIPLAYNRVKLPSNTFSRTITVYVIGEPPLKVTVYKRVNREVTIFDLIVETAKQLRLSQSFDTLQTFAIYLYHKNLPILTSKRVFLPDEILPREFSQVVFRRLSFGAMRECKCWKQDLTALTLLYREAQYAQIMNLVTPKFRQKDAQKLASLSNKEDRDTMLDFMKYFSESSEYWWKYYHRVEDCTFLNEKEILKAFDLPPKTKLKTVSPNWDNFLIMDEDGHTCIQHPTIFINAVYMHKGMDIVILEVAIEKRSSEGYDEKFLFPITVKTSFYHYLNGLAVHAFDTSCFLKKNVKLPFFNPLFIGPAFKEWYLLKAPFKDLSLCYNSVFNLDNYDLDD